MKVNRPLNDEESSKPRNFPSANFTVNTVSTSVTENARIGSEWIDSAQNHLQQREEAIEESKTNIKQLNISLNYEKSTELKRKRVLVLLAVFTVIWIIVAGSVGAVLSVNGNEDAVDDNENGEEEEDQRVEFFSTDEDIIEFVCANITNEENLFDPDVSEFAFGVCLSDDNDEVLLCESDGNDREQDCRGLGGICNCTQGQFVDLRSLGVNIFDQDVCGAGVTLNCVPLEDDLAIELEPIAE